MSNNKNTEITANKGFAVMTNRNVLNEAMADDCQGLEFTFDRVKLPIGGATAFEIPSAESEDTEMAKDITGVIVYNHPANVYYRTKYTVRLTDSAAVKVRARCAKTSVCCTYCLKANCSL